VTSADRDQLRKDYDESALGYSEHWGPGLNDIAARFLRELDLPKTGVIGDIGCGAGGLLPFLEARTGARLLAVDLALGMVRLVDARYARAVMDAQALALADDTLAAAVAMFMLFHLPDPAAGLAELRRVLRPGGMCAFTTWGEDDQDFIAFDVFDEVLDRHGAGEGRPLFARYAELETPQKCRDLLHHAGFTDVAVRAERMAYQFSVDSLIGFRTRVGSGRVKWETLPTDRRTAALREGREALGRLRPEELTLRDEVIYAWGAVPSSRASS
jgi:SAM-dependent methyltransferase